MGKRGKPIDQDKRGIETLEQRHDVILYELHGNSYPLLKKKQWIIRSSFCMASCLSVSLSCFTLCKESQPPVWACSRGRHQTENKETTTVTGKTTSSRGDRDREREGEKIVANRIKLTSNVIPHHKRVGSKFLLFQSRSCTHYPCKWYLNHFISLLATPKQFPRKPNRLATATAV